MRLRIIAEDKRVLAGLIVLILLTQVIDSHPIERRAPFGRPVIGEEMEVSQVDRSLHAPINLTSDTDLMEQASINGWSGNGTHSNPIIIEDIQIIADGVCFGAANITKFFVLRNSILETSAIDTGAIYLNAVSNGRFENCTIVADQNTIHADGAINCTFENNILTTTKQYAMLLENSKNCVIRNNTINGEGTGIRMESTEDSIISWNLVFGFSARGMSLYNVTGTKFYNNRLWNNERGGFVGEFTSNCEFANNVIHDNLYGIFLIKSQSCKIANNSMSHNIYSGVKLSRGDRFTLFANDLFDNGAFGVSLYSIEDTLIQFNTIYGNGKNGIDLFYCNETVVNNNMIHGNLYYGVYLSQWNNQNMIYGNHIGWNHQGNAGDDCNKTNWDNGVDIGNAWSDYNGSKVYVIDGTGNRTDKFPSLFVDNIPPRLNHPQDMVITEGEVSATITWTAIEYEPAFFWVYRNDSILSTGPWDGSAIMVELSQLSPGMYVFALVVQDKNGQSANDSVLVRVLANTIGPIDLQTTIQMVTLLGGLMAIVILGGFELKNRR